MDTLFKYIASNSKFAIPAAVLLLAAAGFILKRLKVLAIVFVALASIIIYALLHSGAIKSSDMDRVREHTKDRIFQRIK
jgi:hypothetical protein